MPTRQTLPSRRRSVTQKIVVGRRRTIYLSTQDADQPLELFVRVRGKDCRDETVALYDCLARMISLALQYGCPVETVGTMLAGVQCAPAGIVTGHPTLHFCRSVPDAIGQHLLSLLPPPP